LSELRIVGLILGIVLLIGTFLCQRFVRRISRFTLLLSLLFGGALVGLALFPDSLNDLLLAFNLRRGSGQRLIGLLMFATLLLFIFTFVLSARNDELRRTVDRLVIEMTKKAYEGEPINAPIAVVIAAYEEEENIGLVLSRMPKQVCGKDVEAVVVVDGGKDRTAEVVKQHNVGVATHIMNRGQGLALRVGYELAIEHGASIVVTMDADNQHDPAEMERLVQPLLDDKADFVVGSRVLGTYEKESAIRAWGVIFFNRFLTAITGRKITDCSSGYRAIRTACLKHLKLVQRQYQTTEMLLEVLRHGFRFMEVPITISARAYGKSKKGPTLTYAIGFFRTIILTWLR